MSNHTPDPTWNTDAFIQYEFNKTDVTANLCESAIQFAENNPDIDEHDYRQFRAIRDKVEAAFSNPYDLDRVDDETGMGYSVVVGYYQTPSDVAWSLLDRYFKLNGWLHFEQSFHSSYKWVTTHRDIVTDESSGSNYLIKVYHKLETKDGLADS